MKQKVWVQLPSVTPCCRCGSTEKGIRLVSGTMLVRIHSSALTSRWCNGQHKTLLRSWTRFDSWTGYSTTCLASVMAARWSSEPQDGVRLPGGVLKSTCPGSVPDSHASPRSSKIRFDSWPGHLHVSRRVFGKGRCPMSKRNFDEQPFFSRR